MTRPEGTHPLDAAITVGPGSGGVLFRTPTTSFARTRAHARGTLRRRGPTAPRGSEAPGRDAGLLGARLSGLQHEGAVVENSKNLVFLARRESQFGPVPIDRERDLVSEFTLARTLQAAGEHRDGARRQEDTGDQLGVDDAGGSSLSDDVLAGDARQTRGD